MIDQRDPPNPLGAGGVAAGRAGDVVEAGEGAVLGRERERPLRVQIESDRERRTDRAAVADRDDVAPGIRPGLLQILYRHDPLIKLNGEKNLVPRTKKPERPGCGFTA